MLCAAVGFQSLASACARQAGLVSAGRQVWAVVLNPWYAGQLLALGLQAVCWMAALRRIPLSTAYPCMSLVLLLNLGWSKWVFEEQVSSGQYFAMLLILAGVFLVLRGAGRGNEGVRAS